ncbi:MAG: alcohol dehydrogenase [Planctomycetes bacterium]|nr:alcohol dehydrogenase [Planctomycetota bacterium]NOG53013.1 zinc-binding dehydrogenase [Planctomycetota bacterium]
MRAIVTAKQGEPVHENIEFRTDWPDPPTPLRGEVVLRCEASALNHLDLWVGRGIPGTELKYPRVAGSDACAIVEEIGEGVHPSWKGRRVIFNAAMQKPDIALPGVRPVQPDIEMRGEQKNGTLCERFVCPLSQVTEVGDQMDPIEAAAFGLTFLTAWRCLVTRAQLRSGMLVLITGIGGGVATAGLKIAHHFGCQVIVTSTHAEKIERAKTLGAIDGILDEGQTWCDQIRQMTNKRGVDIVLDSIGAATYLNCIRSLARGGTLVTPGCTSGANPETDLLRIFWLQLNILGSTMGDAREFDEVTSLYRTGVLRPVIDSVHNAEDGVKAYERLESGQQFGKVVVRW